MQTNTHRVRCRRAGKVPFDSWKLAVAAARTSLAESPPLSLSSSSVTSSRSPLAPSGSSSWRITRADAAPARTEACLSLRRGSKQARRQDQASSESSASGAAPAAAVDVADPAAEELARLMHAWARLQTCNRTFLSAAPPKPSKEARHFCAEETTAATAFAVVGVAESPVGISPTTPGSRRDEKS